MSWELRVQLADSDQPLFQRIAMAIATDIERGRLLVGSRLTSSRALADQLGVNRNTVIAAYDQLRAHGWIATDRTRGAFVVGVPPAAHDHLAGADGSSTLGYPTTAGFDVAASLDLEVPTPRVPGLLLLLGGVPELRSFPHRVLARAYRAALAGHAGPRNIDHAHPQGHPRLRAALVELMARTRGVAAPTDAITVVRGSQHGIYLAGRALLRPGDRVAVEALGYRPAWRALELCGATLVPIAVDRDGLDVDALAAAGPLRAVYTTPHHQVPTTVTMSRPRRAQLLALARARRMVILEDDHDHEFQYDGPPVLPLAADDRSGVVVYLGTLSKCLAPGLRLGYVVAPLDVTRQLAAYRRFVDGQGDPAMEQAIATLLEDDDVRRHASRALRTYRLRREALCDALRAHLPALDVTVPSAGMALWARAPGVDTDLWVARGRAAGVAFQAGSAFRFDRQADPHVRLGFGACDEAELREAVLRLAAVWPGGEPS